MLQLALWKFFWLGKQCGTTLRERQLADPPHRGRERRIKEPLTPSCMLIDTCVRRTGPGRMCVSMCRSVCASVPDTHSPHHHHHHHPPPPAQRGSLFQQTQPRKLWLSPVEERSLCVCVFEWFSAYSQEHTHTHTHLPLLCCRWKWETLPPEKNKKTKKQNRKSVSYSSSWYICGSTHFSPWASRIMTNCPQYSTQIQCNCDCSSTVNTSMNVCVCALVCVCAFPCMCVLRNAFSTSGRWTYNSSCRDEDRYHRCRRSDGLCHFSKEKPPLSVFNWGQRNTHTHTHTHTQKKQSL